MARRPRRRAFAPIQILRFLFRDEVTPNRRDDEAAASPPRGAANPLPATLQESVRGWRVARSLMRLLDQVNAIAPNRKKASDGTIGDARHQTRNSDHNPWVVDGTLGVVTARDITDDEAGGCSAQAIADAIVASRDKRVKYIIWNRRIISSQVQPWTWRPYAGSNPHTKHVHISVLPAKAAYDDESDWTLTEVQLRSVVDAFGVDRVGEVELAWGQKVSAAFKAKVVTIAAKLGVDPNFLMAAMAFETGRKFKADVVNPVSGATGLIQFMPATARSLGTTTAALARMSEIDQLDFVEAYFKPYAGKLRDLEDVYMAILWPRAVGKPASFMLFPPPARAYNQNRGLDANDDGAVTKAEAANRVQQHLIEGMREGLRG
jgi:hypothetical protein